MSLSPESDDWLYIALHKRVLDSTLEKDLQERAVYRLLPDAGQSEETPTPGI